MLNYQRVKPLWDTNTMTAANSYDHGIPWKAFIESVAEHWTRLNTTQFSLGIVCRYCTSEKYDWLGETNAYTCCRTLHNHFNDHSIMFKHWIFKYFVLYDRDASLGIRATLSISFYQLGTCMQYDWLYESVFGWLVIYFVFACLPAVWVLFAYFIRCYGYVVKSFSTTYFGFASKIWRLINNVLQYIHDQ